MTEHDALTQPLPRSGRADSPQVSRRGLLRAGAWLAAGAALARPAVASAASGPVERTSSPRVVPTISSSPVAQPSGGKLTIAAVQGNEDAALKAIAPQYQQRFGVAVAIVEFPYDQLFEKLVTTFQANNAAYDLAMLDDPWMPKFGTSGWLQPLESYGFQRDPDIPSVVYDVGTWPPPRGAAPPSERGKPQQLLGITVVGNVELFMYRKDLSQAPASWDDVLSNAKEFNKPGSLAGYVIRGKATNPIVADFLPILWSFGGDVFDDAWNVKLTSPESLRAVRFLVEDLKGVAEPGAENVDAADRSRLMAIGQAYQSTVWPGEITGIVENAQMTQVSGKVDYIPMPAGPSGRGIGMMGNWLLAVPKATQNGQAAADFIKWITSPDVQRTYVDNGGIPSRTSILTDTGLNQKNPYFNALSRSLDAGPNWRPRTDQWNAVETILGTNLNAALAGLQRAEDAMATAADQIHAVMQNAGY